MNLTFRKDAILFLSVMAFLAGCATDNPLRGRLVTEIYPAFSAFNLPIYAYYTVDKFEADRLPEIKECVAMEDGRYQIFFAQSSGGEKYLIVNRFGRIIEAKGFK